MASHRIARSALLALTIAVGVLFPSTARAYFQSSFATVRAMGMGGAFVAVAEGADALLWNPAGIAQSSEPQFAANYENRFAGLDIRLYDGTRERFATQYVGVSTPVPSDFGWIGLGWHRLDTALLDENVAVLAFARPLRRNVRAAINWRWMGLALKGNEYTRLNPALPDGSESRWASSVDVGTLVKAGKDVWFGAFAENLRAPRIGFADGEATQRRWSVGVARRTRRFTQALDVSRRGFAGEGKDETSFRAGVEYRPVPDRLAVRAGYDLHTVTAGMSFGWQASSVRVELHYAALFATDGPRDAGGSHQFGLSLAFD